MPEPRVYVADGNYHINRAFHAAVARRNPDNMDRNMAQLFLSFMSKEITKFNCTHALVAFDSATIFRYAIYPEYKGTRHLDEGGLVVNTPKGERNLGNDSVSGTFLNVCRNVTKAAGIKTARIKGLEADDVLSAMAMNLNASSITLSSRDKDILSTMAYNNRVRVYWSTEQRIISRDMCMKHYGVYPEQMVDYLCLIGDSVDNIPGVPGVGKDTARKWLKEFGSIAKALQDDKVRDRLTPHKKMLLIAKQLITLKSDDVGITVDDLELQKPDMELLKTLVWKVPEGLVSPDALRAKKMKGLFG